MTITCKYSCTLCGTINAPVVVHARGEESVGKWMDDVCVPAIMKEHRRRSPYCHPKTLSNIMIPVTGADRIGGPNLQ